MIKDRGFSDLALRTVRFVSSDHEPESSQDLILDGEAAWSPTPPIHTLPSNTHEDFQIEHHQAPVSGHGWINNPSPHQSALQHTPVHSSLQLHSPASHFSARPHSSIGLSPAQSAGRAYSNQLSSPVLLTTPSTITSPNYGLGTSWPFASLHEARLLHHYIVHVSLQVWLFGPWTLGQ